MRTPALILAAMCALYCAGPCVFASDQPASSDRIRQVVADKLPKFTPPAPAPVATPADPATSVSTTTDSPPATAALAPLAEGEELLKLPDFRVTEPKIFGPDEDDWLTGPELTRKALRLAESDMTALDLALNRWHIPYLTPSFAARARAAYEQQRLDREMDRLQRLVELSEALELDPDGKLKSPFGTKPLLSLPLSLDLTRRRQ